jgi:hypothetical protein
MQSISKSSPRDGSNTTGWASATLGEVSAARPAWLEHAHRALDEAVFAAYGWDPGLSDEELLARLLALNFERSAGQTRP